MSTNKKLVAVFLSSMLLSVCSSARSDSDIPAPENESVQNIKISYSGSELLVNGMKRPILITSASKRNYFEITNQSQTKSAYLVIPYIEYKVLAKNKISLGHPLTVSADEAGREVIWLEPNTSLTLSLINDYVETPIQAIVSINGKSKSVISLFGPDKSDKFSLVSVSDEKNELTDSQLGIESLKIPVVTDDSKFITVTEKKRQLNSNQTYTIATKPKTYNVEFSEFVFIPKRNRFIGGTGYWTKNATVAKGEALKFVTMQKTKVRTSI